MSAQAADLAPIPFDAATGPFGARGEPSAPPLPGLSEAPSKEALLPGLSAQGEAVLGSGAGARDGDAAVTPAPVAPSADASPAVVPACGGTRFGGVCWYLGAPDASCNDTCRDHGGYRDEATTFVGTLEQGGSPEECAGVLEALGTRSTVRVGPRADDIGVGCHFFGTEDDPWWLSAPPFEPGDALRRARLVCGCEQ